MAHDRLGSDVLKLTHEFLALMLGVRRAGVTTALGHLETKGVLLTARGAVTIVDRGGLEDCADGLYGQAGGGARAFVSGLSIFFSSRPTADVEIFCRRWRHSEVSVWE